MQITGWLAAALLLATSACGKRRGGDGGVLPFVAPDTTFTAATAPAPADEPREIAERERRRLPVAAIVPLPVPTSLPLVGTPGKDADGYPLQAVDRAAFRSMLLQGEHAALNKFFDEVQAAFEADPRKEYWPTGAGDAFASPERALRESLDGWVRATPDHFAPLLARATHLASVASAARGSKWAKDTAAGDFAAMDAAQGSARQDLERALALRPKLVAAPRLIIKMAMAGDRNSARPALDAALATCPSCFQVRVAYLGVLDPRWGGSFADMTAFAAAVPVASNPRLRLLPGFVELDRARDLASEGKKAEALAAAEKACALGEFWPFLSGRGERRLAVGDTAGALRDLDRAAALAPADVGLLFLRTRAHLAAKQPEAAAKDLRAALRVEPADEDARGLLDRVVKALVYSAWEQDKAGKRDDALRLLDLAADLAPGDQDIVKRRVSLVQRGPNGDDLPKLEAAAKAAPTDFRAHQALDYALAKRRQPERVVAMWDGFLKRVPKEPRAYYERAGALHDLGKKPAALEDYDKACTLGLTEACAAARKERGG